MPRDRRPGRRTARPGKSRARADELSRLRTAIDSIDEGFQIIGFDWHYLYVSAGAARHGLRAPEELLGRTMMECYPGIEQTEMFRALEGCLRSRRPAVMENKSSYPFGQHSWSEARIYRSDEGILVLAVDVWDRKR